MPFVIGLEYIKNECNMGTVLRSCYNFNASLVFTVGKKYLTQASDTTKSIRHIPVIHFQTWENAWQHLPQRWTPIGIEITDNAKSIINFVHPRSAIYLFGPENGSLSRYIVKRCKYILKIPSNQCLNLGVCASIVMYDRMLKGKGNEKQKI
jgi:tRNA G18 (ribose-2'-O)-methylase SpoU